MAETSQAFAVEPRIAHNRDLATKYLADNAIYARWPRVSKQAQCLPLDLSALPKYAYNPSIIDHNGMVLMAYRFHQGTLATALGLAHINDAGKILSNRILGKPAQSEEDPKLFKWQGKVCMSWVDSTWPQQPPRAVVRFGVFKDGTLTDFDSPQVPGNDGSSLQKNYVLFEAGDSLYCIYREHPRQIYQMTDNRKWDLIDQTQPPAWPYGEIRGGTAPLKLPSGYLLRFFHSALDNEWCGSQPRRYFVGAYLMEPEPPFKVTRVSKKPIIYGSEMDDVPIGDRAQIIHHKINVAFPGGAVTRDDHWLLALGVNDSSCAVAKITEEMLNL